MEFKKVYVEVTNSCNLSCDFCIKNDRKIKFINKDEFEIMLDKLKDVTKYLYFHVLGEPLMHPDINYLIDRACNVGYKVNITINGYLIDRIKDNKNIRQLNISLHSYNTKYNIDIDKYLSNIVKVVDNLVKNNTIINYRLWVDYKYNDYICKYLSKYYDVEIDGSSKKISNNIYIDKDSSFIWPDLNNNYYNSNGRCYGLITHFGILVDGTIIPCCLDSKGIINLGNIYKDNIKDVMESDRVKDMIRGFKNNKKCEELCKHCKFLD